MKIRLFNGLKGKSAKETFSFGLDIGSREIKIAKLKFFHDNIELCGFDVAPVPSDLGGILKKLKQSMDVESVNIGLCGPSTVIRYVDFPLMNKDELKQALKFEAQKYIPFSMSEVDIDAYVLKENLPENKMVILIAAVKKELINQRLKILGESGLKANIIDIDSLALVNAFNCNYSQEADTKDKVIALLNIGSALSSLNILENGLPRLSRDIHIAGNNFTQKLADVFGLDFKSAEELKLGPDKERLNKVLASVGAVLANLASEARLSFDFYESQSTSSVTKIFLSGGGSKFHGLKDELFNLLGIDVEYWDPLKLINISDTVNSEKAKAASSQLAVAVGLALRG